MTMKVFNLPHPPHAPHPPPAPLLLTATLGKALKEEK